MGKPGQQTSFALLFLLRATKKGEVTGENRAASALPTYASKEDSPMRAPCRGALADDGVGHVGPPGRASRVTASDGHVQFTRVEYLVDDGSR